MTAVARHWSPSSRVPPASPRASHEAPYPNGGRAASSPQSSYWSQMRQAKQRRYSATPPNTLYNKLQDEFIYDKVGKNIYESRQATKKRRKGSSHTVGKLDSGANCTELLNGSELPTWNQQHFEPERSFVLNLFKLNWTNSCTSINYCHSITTAAICKKSYWPAFSLGCRWSFSYSKAWTTISNLSISWRKTLFPRLHVSGMNFAICMQSAT